MGAAPAASQPRGRGLSIFQKLLLLTLSLIAMTVTLPAVYLPARQLQRMQAALEAKALAHARLVATSPRTKKEGACRSLNRTGR
jgi:sensor histidine kinase regulating citrate/malate metabolism